MKKFKISILLFLLFFGIACNDNYPKIGHYKLIQGPMHGVCLVDTLENKNGVMIIDEHILFYGYNSEFILLNHKPEDSLRNTSNGNQEEIDQKVYADGFNQYYIFNLKKRLKYGPFNKKEYLKIKNELGVPEKLKMNYSTLEFYIEGQRNDVNYKYPDSDVIDVGNLKGNQNSSFW